MPNVTGGHYEIVLDEVILNGIIYRRVMSEDCVEPEILVNNIPYVLYSRPPENVDSAPRQGESRGAFKTYKKSIVISDKPSFFKTFFNDPRPPKPSLLRKCWQGIVHDFKVVFNLH